jgi:hypothetical protein
MNTNENFPIRGYLRSFDDDLLYLLLKNYIFCLIKSQC